MRQFLQKYRTEMVVLLALVMACLGYAVGSMECHYIQELKGGD